MDKKRFEKIEDIYQTVIDLPVDKRTVFLEDNCRDDRELSGEIEALLSYEAIDSGFIDNGPAGLIAEVFSDEKQSSPAIEHISHYKVERLLGEGGMGKVYLAEDLKLHRRVALKVLPEAIVGDGDRLLRFEREAQAASALNHPNILTVHEFGEDSGSHYIATEFVDGLTVRSLLSVGAIEIKQVLDIAIQAASALTAAHEAGITHRDIKPENIMLRRDGYVKVLDFGLAKVGQPEQMPRSGSEDPTKAQLNTAPGVVMGTEAYMSPEQARGNRLDARTDIWSLGVCLYEMLAGVRPFSGKTPADTVVAILTHEPSQITSLRPGLPSEVDWIISKCIAKDVDARYQSANDLRVDLVKLKGRVDSVSGLGASEIPPRGIHSTVDNDPKASIGNLIHSTVENAPETTKKRGFKVDAEVVNAEIRSEDSASAVPRKRSKVGMAALAVLLIGSMIAAASYFAFFASRSDKTIDSIAVLPLENQTGDASFNFASDGLSSEIIDRFAQLPQLKVISRNSSFKFRGSDLDQKAIADQLGVRVLVSGSIAKVNDSLAIRVDVEDVAENRQLFGVQFQRKADDLAGIQREIAQTTVERLKLKLTASQRSRFADKVTENSEAYRYYLNGLVELNGPQDVRGPALESFQHSVDLDPDFAEAYVEIAWVFYSRAMGSDDPNVLMPKAKAATERALALDPELAKAHVMSAVMHEFDYDWRAAETDYGRAIELSPNLDFARNNYAFFLSVMNRQQEALAQLEEQRVRDPLNQRLALLEKAIVLVQTRRFDEALETYAQAQAVEPSNEVPPSALAYAYHGKGLMDQAELNYKKSIANLGGDNKYSQPLVYLAALYAHDPAKRPDARALLTKIETMPGYKSPAILAIAYAALDDNDRAIQLLEQSYIRHDPLLRFIGVGYEYDGLRNDQRFEDLERRIGLAK